MPKAKTPKTIREKLEAALVARGFRAFPEGRGSDKRRIYAVPGGSGTNYYLGKAGSLRFGRTFSESIASAAMKAKLLAEYEASQKQAAP